MRISPQSYPSIFTLSKYSKFAAFHAFVGCSNVTLNLLAEALRQRRKKIDILSIGSGILHAKPTYLPDAARQLGEIFFSNSHWCCHTLSHFNPEKDGFQPRWHSVAYDVEPNSKLLVARGSRIRALPRDLCGVGHPRIYIIEVVQANGK